MFKHIDALDDCIFRQLTKLEVMAHAASRRASLSGRGVWAAILLLAVLLTALVPFLSTGKWSPEEVDGECLVRFRRAWNESNEGDTRTLHVKMFPMHPSNLVSVTASFLGYCTWLFMSPHQGKNKDLDRKRKCAHMPTLI